MSAQYLPEPRLPVGLPSIEANTIPPVVNSELSRVSEQ